MTVYKDRADYTPPPCQRCGGPVRPSWVDIVANFDTVGSVVVQLECLSRCHDALREVEDYLASIGVPTLAEAGRMIEPFTVDISTDTGAGT